MTELHTHDRLDGVKAAIRHVEVAERYLERGRNDDEPDAFNDVIYRCNQAFEGMLKEAYSAIHVGKDVTKLSPNEIEQYFVKSEKLAERVSTLFKNYRQQWRNPSTHDHTILFSEQEAILAIASVSAFSLVLINQIVEQVNFKRQQQETERRREAFQDEWAAVSKKPLAEQTLALLKLFERELSQKGEPLASEAELIGRFSGFVAGLKVGIDITTEAKLGAILRADLLLRRGDEATIVEVKRRGRGSSSRLAEAAIAQMVRYLSVADAGSGIIYFWSSDGRGKLQERQLDMESGKNIWVLGDV
ncbi:MAG: hypothetical protein M3Y57_08965 [Acidobacteriota bacterium]|nr:hypothetical protein [Acidobacteriota bacterium]